MSIYIYVYVSVYICICVFVCLFVCLLRLHVFRMYQRIWTFLVISPNCHVIRRTTSSCLIDALKDRI